MLYRLLAVYGAAALLQRRSMSFMASRASGKDRRRIQRVSVASSGEPRSLVSGS